MKSKYTKCLENAKKDTDPLKKQEGSYNLTTEQLDKISRNQVELIQCIQVNRDDKLESDKVEILKHELHDLKAILKEVRIIEQAFLEKILENEKGSTETVLKRLRARDRNRMVISKLQEEIFEVGFELQQLIRYREPLKYILVGIIATLAIESFGILLYNTI